MMSRRNEGLLDLLILLPWWVSVCLAGLVYVGLAFVIPSLNSDNMYIATMLKATPQVALLFAFIFLLPAPISAFRSWRKRRLLDEQESLSSIRSLSWSEFEQLVGEAYRRKGYKVLENESPGADGGVDIVLLKDGRKHLVQCKQWRRQKVGVSVIREMYGVLVDAKAQCMIVVCSGIFTQDAVDFAIDKPIDLIDGKALEELVGKLRNKVKSNNVREKQKSTMTCKKCGSALVLRTAKKGKYAGEKFYGCTDFPRCRYTQAV